MVEIKSVELSAAVRLQYVEQGNPAGIPVLLLPGLSDSWHSFQGVLPHLHETIRAFAISMRGHGDSSRPAGGYTARDFAADTADFMDALDLAEAVVVGHSMGSLVARRFAIEYPERTLGLILVGAVYTEGNPGVVELQQAVSELSDPVDPQFVRVFQESTLSRPVPPAFLDNVVRESLKVPVHVWRAAVAGLAQDDSSGELDRIRAPTLIISGERDELCPPHDQEALRAAIAGSRLVVYRGAGHGVHWEEPERFASDLMNFIEAAAGRT